VRKATKNVIQLITIQKQQKYFRYSIALHSVPISRIATLISKNH